jgi:Domain of unknown function (DUF4271)
LHIKSYWLKQVFFLLLLTGCSFLLPAQVPQDSITAVKTDSVVVIPTDSNSILQPAVSKDSIPAVKKDTVVSAAESYYNKLQKALKNSSFLNASGAAVATVNKERTQSNSDLIFYFLLGLVILLSFLRFFFSRYFFNLFRVFFNTSLRQGQLTDQLLQAKQASMFFNILFFFTAGIYIYFLLLHFNWLTQQDDLIKILICTGVIAIIYFLKFINMKFTGWLTGHSAAANTYLFIIFLINKILGILLIPFIIVVAFSPGYLKKPAVIISLLMVGIMLMLRFLRSFSLLHKQIKVSRFHFFLYITGIEFLPVLLIYKGVMILLNKNL